MWKLNMEMNVEIWKSEYGNVEVNVEVKYGNMEVNMEIKIISNFISLSPF